MCHFNTSLLLIAYYVVLIWYVNIKVYEIVLKYMRRMCRDFQCYKIVLVTGCIMVLI